MIFRRDGNEQEDSQAPRCETWINAFALAVALSALSIVIAAKADEPAPDIKYFRKYFKEPKAP